MHPPEPLPWGSGKAGNVIVYSDGPFWLRVLIAFGAAVLFGVLAWRYYEHFWRR